MTERVATVPASARDQIGTITRPMDYRAAVEDEVGAQLQVSDPNQELRAADFQDVLFTVSDKVVNVLSRESRSEMDEEDKACLLYTSPSPRD